MNQVPLAAQAAAVAAHVPVPASYGRDAVHSTQLFVALSKPLLAALHAGRALASHSFVDGFGHWVAGSHVTFGSHAPDSGS